MLSTSGQLADDCLSQLIDLSTKLKDEDYRKSLEVAKLEDLGKVLLLLSSDVAADNRDVIIEAFRSVRNACVGCTDNQNKLRNLGVIQTTSRMLEACVNNIQEDKKNGKCEEAWFLTVRCGLQCLGNMAVGSPANQTVIWDALCKKLMQSLLQLPDKKVATYTSMIVYNCLLSGEGETSTKVEARKERLKFLAQTPEGVDVSVAIVKHVEQHETGEWGLLIIKELLASDFSILPVYSHLGDKERLFLLEIIHTTLEEHDNKSRTSPVTLRDIAEDFKAKAHTILGLSRADDIDTMEPSLVIKQLSILCLVSSQEDACVQIQNDRALIQCVINLLHTIKMIGEQGGNVFTEETKLSMQGEDSHPHHPVYGLKRDLIRLLANMAHRNKQNQDKIREAGGIHLIMDHSHIDAKNPYIMQWAIFAIHNLCENNLENQAAIADLKLEGVSSNVEALREFGVQAEMQGDKIVVKKVDSAKSPFSRDQPPSLE